jgi:hypothetical protein
MPAPDRVRPVTTRRLPKALAGLAGVACLACCLIPVLLTAGVLGGAGWVALGDLLPAAAIVLMVTAGGLWWVTARRRRGRTACAAGCSCGQHTVAA